MNALSSACGKKRCPHRRHDDRRDLYFSGQSNREEKLPSRLCEVVTFRDGFDAAPPSAPAAAASCRYPAAAFGTEVGTLIANLP
jgi:hypothetical protein